MNKKTDYDAENIHILEGLEAVRKRPGMYIGSTSTRGLNHLVYELLDNAVDEHLAGFCDTIWVSLEENGFCTVKDNGRGIPIDMHEKGVSAERIVLTTLHAGGKFDNEAYKTSGGLHGVGSSVVNALSAQMNVIVRRDRKVVMDSYSRGVPTTELINGLLPVIGKTKETGTEISFLPDPQIFESVVFKGEWLKNRIHETVYLNPGLTIFYSDKRKDSEECLIFTEPDGLISYVRNLANGKSQICEPIFFKGTADDTELECCFTFVNEFEESLHSFCNNIYTQEGGTHVAGLKSQFSALINTYARELGILKEKDSNFTGADTRNGMILVLSVKCSNPIFEGQTKTKLSSPSVSKSVSKIVKDELIRYFDRNVSVLTKIIECAIRSSKIRRMEEKNKNLSLSKTNFSFEGNGKLCSCICKDPEKCEIFIVEGDSAGGSAKTGRDRQTQAILPIRGKILNVEKASIDKVLANVEIKTIIMALGCGFAEGYGNDFDLKKLRYKKIILATDADIDGAHIDTLLLTFFYRFMPELIFAGNIYLAQPPLYKAVSKRNTEYLRDDEALSAYRKKHKDGTYELQRYKGLGEMNAEQLWETTLNPKNRLLKQVTINDAKEASDLVSLLMGNNVEIRKQFIYENAAYANIDI